MVNLAKLRKKAKEKKEKKEPAAVAPESLLPAERGEGARRADEGPAPEPSPGPAPRDHPLPQAGEGTDSNKIAAYLATAGEMENPRATAAEETADSTAQLELLSFVIAGEQYAIDIEEVVEIVTPRPITRVPNADPSVVGIFSLRGTVVMLIDARRRLRHRGIASVGPDTRVIVVRHDAETVGFLVDRVLRVTAVDSAEIEPHPVVHSSEQDDSVRGVFRQADALTIILDLRKLLFTAWN